MILFVFEGKEREPAIFKTIEYLFFKDKMDRIICSYCNNIYGLYKQMTDDGRITDERYYLDLVSVLRTRLASDPDNPLKDIEDSSEISEIYLFFDYDIHNQNKDGTFSYAELNDQLRTMVEFFDDETGHGKLYVNYPMVESIRYTKKLPDPDYHLYTFPVSSLKYFKSRSADFSHYDNLDFASFRLGRNKAISEKDKVRSAELFVNWKHLITQNTEKANYICNGRKSIPLDLDAVSQSCIFENQRGKFISEDNVAVLNSFPLFLFEYFGCDFADS